MPSGRKLDIPSFILYLEANDSDPKLCINCAIKDMQSIIRLLNTDFIFDTVNGNIKEQPQLFYKLYKLIDMFQSLVAY